MTMEALFLQSVNGPLSVTSQGIILLTRHTQGKIAETPNVHPEVGSSGFLTNSRTFLQHHTRQ
jgi:hypothetical protein